jgi:hypothetical protein
MTVLSGPRGEVHPERVVRAVDEQRRTLGCPGERALDQDVCALVEADRTQFHRARVGRGHGM